MYKRRKQQAKYLIGDWITISVAWFVFNLFRFEILRETIGYTTLPNFLRSPLLLLEQAVVPLLFLLLFYYSGYYNEPFRKSRLEEFLLTLKSIFWGSLALVSLLLVNDLHPDNEAFFPLLGGSFVIHFVPLYLVRWIITRDFTLKLHRRQIGFRTLVVGTGKKAVQTVEELNSLNLSLGFIIEGALAVRNEQPAIAATQILGNVSQIDQIVASRNIEEIIVAVDGHNTDTLLEEIYPLYRLNLPIHVVAGDYEILCGGVRMSTIYATPMVDITSSVFSPWEQNVKESLDFLLSAIALLLLSPLLLFIICRIWLTSSGPIFYRQERIGLHGRPFEIIKFRTMQVDAESDGPKLSSELDQRITPFGQFLRKYRLDELPQFWNVLRGEMAIVGPRPERQYYIQQLLQYAPYYHLLHKVRPGITSWGMVKYGYARNIDEMLERLRYDMIYVENCSLLVDFKIWIYTIRTVFLGKGL